MKVILLEDIPGFGKKFDVKETAFGYARNYLFPRKLAIPATPSELKKIEEQKKGLEKKEQELKKELEKIAYELNGKKLIFPVRVDENGAVYGSVTKEDILNSLRDLEMLRKHRIEIELGHPLKELGESGVEIDFKKGIKAKIKVVLEAKK